MAADRGGENVAVLFDRARAGDRGGAGAPVGQDEVRLEGVELFQGLGGRRDGAQAAVARRHFRQRVADDRHAAVRFF
jgi:hypothetical protein